MWSRLLPFALAAGLIFFGIQAYNDAKPERRDKRIYSQLQEFMPYRVEKRMGGLSIVSKLTGKKEKPPASQFYHRLDQLEKLWGKKHLRVDGNSLIVLDDHNKTIKSIELKNNSERSYVRDFFGL